MAQTNYRYRQSKKQGLVCKIGFWKIQYGGKISLAEIKWDINPLFWFIAPPVFYVSTIFGLFCILSFKGEKV